MDLNTAKIQFHAESDDKLFGASHFQTYLYVCVYIYILITLWLHATTHSLVRLKTALFHCESGPYHVGCLRLVLAPGGPKEAGIISKKYFGEILFFGEIKVGLLQICNFWGSFGAHLLRTLFLVCKKNGALALTVKKLRVCICVISLFATINI